MPDGPAEDMGGKDFMAFSTIGDKTSTERTFADTVGMQVGRQGVLRGGWILCRASRVSVESGAIFPGVRACTAFAKAPSWASFSTLAVVKSRGAVV